MLRPYLQECLKTRSKISNISSLSDDSIAFSTNSQGAKIFCASTCSLTKHIFIELLDKKTKATAFSKEHNLLAFANEEIIYIINLQNKNTIETIKTYDGEIEILAFAQNSAYLVAGTKDGRVSQYRFDAKSQLSRLCSFPHKREFNTPKIKNNYVSVIAFHGDYMACSGYGGSIVLIKMSSLANKRVIESSKNRINALCFLDNERLVSGCVNGTIQIYSLQNLELIYNIKTPFRDINNIIQMPNKYYAMISAKSDKIGIINLITGKLVSKDYLSFEDEIAHILLVQNENLFIVLQNNTIYKFQLPNQKELQTFLLDNKLQDALKLIESDPMLVGTQEDKRAQLMYEKLCTLAVNALVNGQEEKAHQLIEVFRDVASKKDEITSIFKDFKHFDRFKILSTEKKFALVYAMSEKFPFLKRTQEFKKIEEGFKEAFTHAQKQLLQERRDRAEEALSPYITVRSKKTIITLLLKQNKEFIAFLKAVQMKDYAAIEKLLEKNEYFAQIPSYETLKNFNENALENIRNFINTNELDEAIQEIKKLQKNSAIKEELKELYGITKLVQALNASYEENNFKECYEMIDTHFVLGELKLSKLLEKHWSKLIDECEKYALGGDIKSIKNRLGELIGVKTRFGKIGDLFRISFHSKIKIFLEKRNFTNAENLIYSYIDIFGLDSELLMLMKSYESLTHKKLAITLNQERVLSRDNWVNSPFIFNASTL